VSATHAKLEQGVRSRERLLEAAASLVGAGGYAATSVDSIATEAGVVKSALYWHFGSKHGLLLAAIDQATGDWIRAAQAAVDEAVGPADRLDRLLTHVRRLIVERPATQRLVFSLLLERADGDPEVRAACRRIFAEQRGALARGLAETVPLSERAAADLANAFVAQCHGLLLHHLAEPDTEALDRALRVVRRMMLLAIDHEIGREK